MKFDWSQRDPLSLAVSEGSSSLVHLVTNTAWDFPSSINAQGLGIPSVARNGICAPLCTLPSCAREAGKCPPSQGLYSPVPLAVSVVPRA